MSLISNRNITMYDELKKSILESDEIFMNVSFIRDSGLKLLIDDLKEAHKLGKKIKILTSNYMNITEPNALYRLIDIPNIKLYSGKNSFHSKSYIFKKDKTYKIYVGSSNISKSALKSGVEWNYKFTDEMDLKGSQEVLNEFYELYDNNSFELTLDWLRKYEKSYVKSEFIKVIDPNLENDEKKLEPIKFQIPALYELSKTREEGYTKAIVVVGTGLGKTYLSAFDSMNFKRVLFVAHRDEILRDAKKTFETVFKNSKTYGFFNGYEKDIDRDITFASISTISKDDYLNLNYFKNDNFDYIVIDEFHHADAPSYKKVIEYFTPKFLLGLTATPDRADSGDIYKLCDYNIAYECDFKVGINNGWLTPFEYFGVYDETDYSLIPWRSGKYDMESLENSLIIEKRLELVYKKYLEYRKKSTLGFCASVKHCSFMNEYFLKNKIKSAMIVGDTPVLERQEIISKFKKGELEIIFTVDVFNEGVDIPCVDTILFLRPTTSYTIFIQQLGRGLRTYEGKERLRVVDFVGNYKGSELKPMFLMGQSKKNINKTHPSPIDSGFILPLGCSANFDFKVIEYFQEIKNKGDSLKNKIKQDFFNVKDILGKTPSIMDIYTFGEIPVHTYLQKFKSWYNFLEDVNELSQNQKSYSKLLVEFLQFLEKTSMTKSYKIPLLMSIINNNFNTLSLEAIGSYFKDFYSNDLNGKDLNNKKHRNWKEWPLKEFEKLAFENPINFLTKDESNKIFFTFENNNFILNENLYREISCNKESLQEVNDRLTYRNSNYFRRKYLEE